MVLRIAILSTLLLAQAQAEELFCIHPAGTQTQLAQCASTGACTGPATSCSLATANQQLQPDQTALLMPGKYQDKIRPVSQGKDNALRITYRATGAGDVILEDCTGPGSTLGAAGAINYDEKDYLSVYGDGRLKVYPTKGCAIGVSLCGSLGGIIDGVVVHSCPQEPGPVTPDGVCTNHIGRLVSFCNEAFNIIASRPTQHNVFSNNTLIGNLDNSKRCATCTEDALVIEQPQVGNIIRGNTILNATHVALKATLAQGHSVVIYDNTITNIAHTPVSVYRAGGLRPEPHTYDSGILLSGNRVVGSYGQPVYPFAGPGNGLQGGAGGMLIRHNTFTHSGTDRATGDATNMVTFSWGNGGAKKRIACARNYFLNNTFSTGSGNMYACKQNFAPDDVRMIGGNKLWNNIFKDVLPTAGSSGQGSQIFYSSVAKLGGAYTNKDRWVSNYFGDKRVPEKDSIVWVSPGPEQTFTQAFTNTQWANDPGYPDFTSWNGFENNYKMDLDTWFQGDFRLNPTAPGIDAGAPVTRISARDTRVGQHVIVDDARWFYDECVDFPAWTGLSCDQICIGPDRTDTNTAQCGLQITAIDQATNTLSLATTTTRMAGDYVWLFRDSHGKKLIHGKAPDIGADEYAAPTTPGRMSVPVIINMEVEL